AATIVSSLIISKGFLKVTKFVKEQVTVTGSAQNDITSDYIVWRSSFSIREASLPTAYKRLNEDLEKVKNYLTKKGVSENDVIASQITTEKIYKKNDKGNDTNDIQWYRLSQAIEVRSNAVEKITQVSRESTDLINDNVEFESQAPEYFYTKLDELKIEMLGKATQNAKARADNMVKSTRNKIGSIRSSKMGVFQITPINSTEVSDWGVNDSTSLEKRVTAVVSASFAIE
ncbi:MAG: SIMPL domain-containing protein, partial [Candidatus Omnitrophica bacterium]|nr:SIMPL domain-containing protein [Candidatus Omnitrophota bacterium]